ncbi:MAG: RNA polymerase sigma factor [Bacteroidia bacterium]|nr:RNA polymerase sigma factor [Bacteroidia bacterium]
MESAWIEALQHEETRLKAFEQLTQKYYSQVRRWVRQWVQDSQAADDVVQETFLRAWEKCHTFRGEAAFASWLYSIARREALRYLRRKAQAELPWIWEEELEPAVEPAPDYQRFLSQVEQAVAEMTPTQQAVFHAVWHEHLPYREVAQRLQVRENTIKAHMHHIRQRLWKKLHQWLGEE